MTSLQEQVKAVAAQPERLVREQMALAARLAALEAAAGECPICPQRRADNATASRATEALDA